MRVKYVVNLITEHMKSSRLYVDKRKIRNPECYGICQRVLQVNIYNPVEGYGLLSKTYIHFRITVSNRKKPYLLHNIYIFSRLLGSFQENESKVHVL